MDSLSHSRHAGRRDWSSLPDLAVFEIATHLNPIEFAALAGVCKSWRTICTQNKTQIHTHHPPLLLALNKHLDSDCLFCKAYSFPDKRLYSKPLPPNFHIPISGPVGCFHGYFLIAAYSSDCNDFYYDIPTFHLANPFTEEFMVMPNFVENCVVFKALLTAPPGSPGSLVVALAWSGWDRQLMVCQPGIEDCWTTVPFDAFMRKELLDSQGYFRQIVFFKGRVYGLTDKAVIGIEIEVGTEVLVRLLEPFYFGNLEMQDSDSMHSRLCLFVGDEELFVVELERKHPRLVKGVYRLQDGKKGMWEKVGDIGGRTLFVSDGFPGFVPSGARLAGFEDGWDDRVLISARPDDRMIPFFDYPFYGVGIDGRVGPLLEAHEFDEGFVSGLRCFHWVSSCQF